MKITLLEWADSYFGSKKPSLRTMRRWASEGKFSPAPQKIGRALFLDAEAVVKGKTLAEVSREREEACVKQKKKKP